MEKMKTYRPVLKLDIKRGSTREQIVAAIKAAVMEQIPAQLRKKGLIPDDDEIQQESLEEAATAMAEDYADSFIATVEQIEASKAEEAREDTLTSDKPAAHTEAGDAEEEPTSEVHDEDPAPYGEQAKSLLEAIESQDEGEMSREEAVALYESPEFNEWLEKVKQAFYTLDDLFKEKEEEYRAAYVLSMNFAKYKGGCIGNNFFNGYRNSILTSLKAASESEGLEPFFTMLFASKIFGSPHALAEIAAEEDEEDEEDTITSDKPAAHAEEESDDPREAAANLAAQEEEN